MPSTHTKEAKTEKMSKTGGGESSEPIEVQCTDEEDSPDVQSVLTEKKNSN